MFTAQLYTLVVLAAGLSASAAPASMKRGGSASPALVTRNPQLNNTNFPFAVNVVLSPNAQNITLVPFKFKREFDDSSSTTDDDDEGVFNFTRHARLPFLSKLPWLVPSNETDTTNSSALETRQVNATPPNQLPVAGVLPLDITLTPGAQNTTVGIPAGFPFKLKRQDDSTTTDDDDAFNGVFNFTNNHHLPLWTKIPMGLVPDNDSNSTVNDTAGGFPFEFWGEDGEEEQEQTRREVKFVYA